MSPDLLFELGTEEIPPQHLPKTATNLLNDVTDGLEENRISFQTKQLYYTPRRVALLFSDLPRTQKERSETIRGPAKHIGLDEQGNYTEAARGFANSHDVDPEQLTVKDTDEGQYFYLNKVTTGKPTTEILPSILTDTVTNLSQPEKMRWDDSGLEFIRPIRWIVCLFDGEPVEFSLGNVTANSTSRGHRFLSEGPVKISDPSEYVKKMNQNGVIVDPQQRRDLILEALTEETKKVGGQHAADEQFINLLVNSLEIPSPVVGNFPHQFLSLPSILLFKTLEGEARLIPTVGEDNNPLSLFIGFRDGQEDKTGKIKRGYESVINARLRDSQFFFDHDRERELEKYVNDLKKITYQERLGSIWEKVKRMRTIANKISKEAGFDDLSLIDRTVFLCKADLATEVVDEFPDLQGQIGAIYAQLDGEKPPVVQGVKEHYSPQSSGDDLPQTETGLATSLADNLDTLIGSFLLGEQPTGTKDPYGLRRKANAVIRIVVEKGLDINIYKLIDQSASLFQFLDMGDLSSQIKRLKSFFNQRLSRALENYYGIRYDVVDAVITTDKGNFSQTYERALALDQYMEEDSLKQLVTSFSRVVNITEGHSETEFDPELFSEEEQELWREFLKKKNKINKLVENSNYSQAIKTLINLKNPIDSYFDKVMVMAKNPELRDNRLNFLTRLKNLFLVIGDLSKLVIENQSSSQG